MDEICKIKDLYGALNTFEKEFHQKYDITIIEAMLLCSMSDGVEKSANEICEFIGLSSSRGSRVINTTESKKFILRHMGEEDKRQMIFTLTDSGEKKLSEMHSESIAIMEKFKTILT